MFKKTPWIIILFVAVIFFVAGYVFSFFGNSVIKNPVSSLNQNTYQAGWDAAKQRLTDSGFFGMAATNAEVKSLIGEIQEISGNKITLKIRPLEPLASESLDVRTVVVDSNTKIFTLEPKDQKEFMAEMDAYTKKMRANIAPAVVAGTSSAPVVPTTPTLPPDGFKKITIALSDLQVGQTISVSSEKNIKEEKEFKALEISYYKPLVSVMPTAQVAPATPAPAPAPAPAPTPAVPTVK